MKKILGIITDKVAQAFISCGYEGKYGQTGISNRPDLCEYQCNGAMAAAKAYKKAPIKIAEEVVGKLATDSIFEEITSVMPGFINIKISTEFLAERINQMAEKINWAVRWKKSQIQLL